MNIGVDALERILEGKNAEQASFPVQGGENLQIPPIIYSAVSGESVLK